jgi:gluconolactonase
LGQSVRGNEIAAGAQISSLAGGVIAAVAILSPDQISVFVHGLDHSEGIAWGLDGFVYAGGESGQIYRINPEKPEAKVIANSGGLMLGLALDAANNIYACDAAHAVIQRITPAGRVSTYCAGAAGEPMVLPNYPVFDQHGNLYVTDSGHWHQDNGKIYKIALGGNAEVWSRKLTEFPNGLCLSADGNYLYVAMSVNPPRVSRVEIRSDGSAGAVETVVELPRTVPDGLAFDDRGNLYISCYRPDIIYRFTPNGQLQVLAEDFEGTAIAAPTNIAFCGEKRDMLLSANIGRWHLTQYHLDAVGQAIHYPSGIM